MGPALPASRRLPPDIVTPYIVYSLGGAAAALFFLAQLRRPGRTAFRIASACAAVAAVALHSDFFWASVCSSLAALCGICAGLNVADLNWRLRFSLVMSVGAVAMVTIWPTFEVMTGGWLPCPDYVERHIHARLVAGLDLRGGLRLVYTVDVAEAIAGKRDAYAESMTTDLAIGLGLHSGDGAVDQKAFADLRTRVQVRTPRDRPDEMRLEFARAEDTAVVDERFLARSRSELTFSQSSDRRVFVFRIKESVQTDIRERAVAQSKDIVLRRIDELGLREASVSTRDDDLVVEVPGQDEAGFESIKNIIGQTARLEFKLLDDETDVLGAIAARTRGEAMPEGIEFSRESAPVGLAQDGEPLTATTTYLFARKQTEETGQQALARLQAWVEHQSVPDDREIGYELVYDTDPETLVETEAGWRTYVLKRRAELTGDLVQDAQATVDQSGDALGQWHVALAFTDRGASEFERITAANVKRRFAIVLDGRVESAPVIQSRIAGGHASITLGSGDPAVQLREARNLELVLRSGALPAPISPVNEQRIGATLGQDSIRQGVVGASVGGGLVMLFMLVYYGRAGLIANFAVGMNLLLQLAVLASFKASMTLPGIAGLALTIGMSVDSNVLINERIREELREGKTPRVAVDLGFRRALSAIIDGHLTTLISAIVLAQFGTGPIKGFAITLMVGVTANIFTGVVVTRVVFDSWTRRLARGARLAMG